MLTNTCQSLGNTPCTGVTLAAITVQIPFELAVDSPQDPSQRSEAILNVQEDGVSSADFLVAAVSSNIHFVTGRGPLALDYVSQASIHGAMVTHADGNPVLPGLPAKPGETLAVYGYGFGRPTNSLKTGDAPQAANPVPLYGSVLFSSLLPASAGTTSGNPESLDSLRPQMIGHGTKFGRKMDDAIAALLTHRNVEEAAAAVPISTKTLLRWMKEPEFERAFRAARRSVFSRSSKEQ